MKKLFVGNLSFGTTKEVLHGVFETYGTVEQVTIVADIEGRSKGFAFVEMHNDGQAANAIAALDNSDLEGRTLTVNESRTKSTHQGGNLVRKHR